MPEEATTSTAARSKSSRTQGARQAWPQKQTARPAQSSKANERFLVFGQPEPNPYIEETRLLAQAERYERQNIHIGTGWLSRVIYPFGLWFFGVSSLFDSH